MSTEAKSTGDHGFVSFQDLVDGDVIGFVPTKTKERVAARRGRTKFYASTKFWFLLMVVVPTLASAVYYSFFAADQYYSEATYIVRTESKSSGSSGLASLLKSGHSSGSTSDRSDDDTYAVQSYITSRDAVERLQKNINLREIFARPEADWLARFPRLPFWNSVEDLYNAYQRFVVVSYDSDQGISTIKVTAFRAQDAMTIASALLNYAEDVVNEMNLRAREDAVGLARDEVKGAEQHFSDAEVQLLEFRNAQLIVDPGDATKQVMDVVGKLAESAALTKAQLMGLQRSAPNTLEIRRLSDQYQAFEGQIDEEQKKLGGSDSAVANKISKYARLQVAEDLAKRDLEDAHGAYLTALEQARQQQLYLEPVVQPIVADSAIYPRRLTIIFSVFAVSLITFGIGLLLVTGAREHVR